MSKVLMVSVMFVCFSGIALAQPRPADPSGAAAGSVRTAPASIEAKYEGGMFGYRDKKEGVLKFDDANSRFVFYDKEKREMISIPYGSLLVVSPTSSSSTSTAGTVISHAPLPGAGLASLLKSKKRYLVLQFDDPDAEVRGVVNFKIANKEMLESVIHTLGTKAKMTQRGDSFYRPRTIKTVI